MGGGHGLGDGEGGLAICDANLPACCVLGFLREESVRELEFGLFDAVFAGWHFVGG